MQESWLSQEAEILNWRVTEFCWGLRNTAESVENGRFLVTQFQGALFRKFHKAFPQENRTMLTLRFPRERANLQDVDAWRENTEFENLIPELRCLSGRNLIVVLEHRERHFSKVCILEESSELFRFWFDHSAGLNKPACQDWTFFVNGEQNEITSEIARLKAKDEPYRLRGALQVLQLIHKRGSPFKSRAA